MLTEERGFPSFSSSCAPLLASQSVNGITSHDEEEINELQEDDRELFSDQLSSIGMMGRVAADHCIPLLTRFARTLTPLTFDLCGDFFSPPADTALLAASWRTGSRGCTGSSRGPSSSSWPRLTRVQSIGRFSTTFTRTSTGSYWSQVCLCSPFCFSPSGLMLYVLNWIFKILLLN